MSKEVRKVNQEARAGDAIETFYLVSDKGFIDIMLFGVISIHASESVYEKVVV